MKKRHLLLFSILSILFANSYSQCTLPTPFAGNDTIFCSSTAILNASTPTAGNTGYWSANSPYISFGNINNPNSNITTTVFGCYEIIWTEEESPTCYNSDTLNICFLDPAGSSTTQQPVNYYDSVCFPGGFFMNTPASYINCSGSLLSFSYQTGTNQLMDSVLDLHYNCLINSVSSLQWVCTDSVANSNISFSNDSVYVDLMGDYSFTIDPGATNTYCTQFQNLCNQIGGCFCNGGPFPDINIHIHYDKPELIWMTAINTCHYVCNGSATFQTNNGCPPYTYNSSSSCIDLGTVYDCYGLCPGLYTITVTDNIGCTDELQFVIFDESPGFNIEAFDVSCYAEDNGYAYLDNIYVQNPPYNIEWYFNSNIIGSSDTINNLQPGNYSVLLYDNSGCFNQGYFQINEPSPIYPDFSISDSILCLNSDTVLLVGSPQGGIFSGNGITNNVFVPYNAGIGSHTINYTCYKTDTNIQWQAIFEDNFYTDLGWSGYGSGGWERGAATPSTGCYGDEDPSSDHTSTSDGFLLGNNIGDCHESNLTSTNWIVSPVIDCSNTTGCTLRYYSHSGCGYNGYLYMEVFDGNNWINLYTNTFFSENTWTWNHYDITAYADHNPDFQVRFGIGPTGSSAGKGWNIDDFMIHGLKTEIVVDSTCSYDTSKTITVVQPITMNVNIPLGVCENFNYIAEYTGTATSNAIYNWDFGQHGFIVSGSGQGPVEFYYDSTGIYTVNLEVIENGCSMDTSLQIIVLPSGSPNCCILPQTEAGSNDIICGLSYSLNPVPSWGIATWSLLSGPGTVNFSDIHNPFTTVTVSDTGTYYFNLEENNGNICVNNDSVAITFYPQPDTLTAIINNSTCYNFCDGAISLIPTNPQYTYEWTGGWLSYTITNLCAGTYCVTITNEYACTRVQCHTVDQPNPLLVNIIVIADSAIANVTGGCTPYSYLWNNGANSQTIYNLTQGWYYVTVYDCNGCCISDSIFINSNGNDLIVDQGLSVFPNPTKDILFIKSPDQLKTVKLYNSNGQLIMLKDAIRSKEIKITLEKLPDAVYYLNIKANNINSMIKIIKINE